jgi:hypothetical protein
MLLDEMDEEDFGVTEDLVDFVVPAHLLHFPDQIKGLGIVSLLHEGAQCLEFFHTNLPKEKVAFRFINTIKGRDGKQKTGLSALGKPGLIRLNPLNQPFVIPLPHEETRDSDAPSRDWKRILAHRWQMAAGRRRRDLENDQANQSRGKSKCSTSHTNDRSSSAINGIPNTARILMDAPQRADQRKRQVTADPAYRGVSAKLI